MVLVAAFAVVAGASGVVAVKLSRVGACDRRPPAGKDAAGLSSPPRSLPETPLP
jgi:hypothetical protein